MLEFISKPWPWYIAGPAIGLMVPLVLIFGGKAIGVSSSLRHTCAMCFPGNIKFFNYNWRAELWNIFFVLGILFGGVIASQFLSNANDIAISYGTVESLKKMGISDFSGFVPQEIFSFENLNSPITLLFVILGGLLVGFGTRYAGGCTSGHTISGLSNLQWPSLIATISFFVGGLIMTHLIFPLIFN